MAAKYKEYFEKMLKNEKGLFERFQKIHDQYALDPKSNQDEFNKEGEKVLLTIQDWENKLCLQSEKAGYASFTTKLSEKFQAEVRKHFPEIDNIGLITETKATTNGEDKSFSIKKINLF